MLKLACDEIQVSAAIVERMTETATCFYAIDCSEKPQDGPNIIAVPVTYVHEVLEAFKNFLILQRDFYITLYKIRNLGDCKFTEDEALCEMFMPQIVERWKIKKPTKIKKVQNKEETDEREIKH